MTQDLTHKDFVQSFIEQEKTFQLDAFDLEKITQTVYGESVEMLESSNDTTHEYTVSASVDKNSQQTLEKAIKNGYLEYWQYGCVLDDLCHKGLVETGKYFVRMSW